MSVRAIAAVSVGSLCIGCSSAYVPAPSSRLSLTMENGHYAYVRDGKKYDGGLFGGDIEDAVQGSPKAEEYAHQYKTGMVTGFAMTMFGVAGVLGGAAVLGVQNTRSTSQTVAPTGLFVMAGGLLVESIGVIVSLNALPHLFDAINAYNDELRQAGANAAVFRR